MLLLDKEICNFNLKYYQDNQFKDIKKEAVIYQ